MEVLKKSDVTIPLKQEVKKVEPQVRGHIFNIVSKGSISPKPPTSVYK